MQQNTHLSIASESVVHAKIAFDKPGACIDIGKRTFIGKSLLVCAENITIGDDVMISWGCTIVDHDSHSLTWEKRAGDVTGWIAGKKEWDDVGISPVIIEDRTWMGFNVTVLKGVRIGEGAVVAACSVVTADVEPYTLVAGNPAKVIRRLQERA